MIARKTSDGSTRTSSHGLQCETRRWEQPKEQWDERLCTICGNGEMETEQHFLLHCNAYTHIGKKAKIRTKDWEMAFQEDEVGATARLVDVG